MNSSSLLQINPAHRPFPRSWRALPGLLVCMFTLAAAVPALSQEPATFVVLLGEDTVAVEQFTRTADRLEGRMVLRTPRVQIREYDAMLGPDGALTSFELRVQTPGEEAREVGGIDFADGTATMRTLQDDSLQTLEVTAEPGALPFLSYSIGIYEPLVSQFLQGERAAIESETVILGSEQKFPLAIESVDDDEVVVTNIAGENRVRIDQEGRILEWDGSESTLKLLAERGSEADIDELAAEFAAREAAEGPLGALSPRDSVQVTVAGATLEVDYSRPATRGRTIFGNVVPFNEVWRTGANAATGFSTDHDLMIGDAHVPAGEYTLFTIPAEDGWTLIINQQTGQPGTEYDEAQDLARVAMDVTPLADPMERFTIGVNEEDTGGLLWMAWANTCATVPFEVQ